MAGNEVSAAWQALRARRRINVHPLLGRTMASSAIRRIACRVVFPACVLLAGCAGARSTSTQEPPVRNALALAGAAPSGIPPYLARPGRGRPVVAVVGDNAGVEVSDFLVPFSILSRAGTMEVSAVTMEHGPLSTFTDLGSPSVQIMTDTTVAQFDHAHPHGADYIIVAAQTPTPALLAWLKQQVGQGATLATICNGALVAAQTGLFDGRRATAHWSTGARRAAQFPGIRWTPNRRYVVDGNWVSTTGVSAAIPVSIALVEAISGRETAQAVAAEIGASNWSAQHDSEAFALRWRTALPLAKVLYTNRWLHGHEQIDVRAAPGVDEATLALTLDAYSSTGRSRAYLVFGKGEPFVTRHGLVIVPDRPQASDGAVPPIVAADTMPVRALDAALDGIMQRYGRATAKGVALAFEYPDYPR